MSFLLWQVVTHCSQKKHFTASSRAFDKIFLAVADVLIFFPPNNINSRSGIYMVVPPKVYLKSTKGSWILYASLKLFRSCNFVSAKHIHSSIPINTLLGSPCAVVEFSDEHKKFFNYSSELQRHHYH